MRRGKRNSVEGILDRKTETEETVLDRRFLLTGFAASKRTRGRFFKKWKTRYVWVTEDLLYLRWCHGKSKDWRDSDENLTFVEVANIGNVETMDDSKLALYLIDDPDNDLCFNVGKDKAQRWKDCIIRLCKDELTYRLCWDERDAGTEISLHWRGEDQWFPGSILGYDIASQHHRISFHDGKDRLYDLTKVFFRIEKLPDARRDGNLYDISNKDTSFAAAHVVKKQSEQHLTASSSFHVHHTTATTTVTTMGSVTHNKAPELVRIEYTPSRSPADGPLESNDTVNVVGICKMYGASLKKDTSMRVQLSNGNTVILTRASDSTYAGTYTVASGINAARDNTSNLTAEEYEVGDAEDDKGNHLLLDVEGIEDAPAFQPTETIVVVVRAPEISSITYTPSSDPPLTTGDYVDIVATCTTSPSTELAQGTAVILQLSNGSDVTLTKTGPKTYAGRYNVVAHDDCDHLTASGYEVGTAADKAGNPMVPCDDFVRKRIKVDDQGKEKTSTGELPLPPAYSISVKGAAFQPTSNIAINTEPAVVPPPVLISIEYSPDNGRQKEGDTVVITATCSKSKPLKKETTITVALSNGRNIVLDRASDNTYVGKYVIQRTGSSVLGYNPSSEQKDDTEDTDDLLAVGYDVGTAEDENGGALVANSPVAGVAAMQPSGHLSVATKIPELIKIEYVIERFGKGAGAGAGAGKATGQATTEDQKPLEAGDKIVITATCTHASSSELKRGTEMTLLMSNGKSVILKHDGRGYDDTYVGEYVIGPDASEDCDVLGASGYNCGTAEDEHGNALDANTTIQSASMFQPTETIIVSTVPAVIPPPELISITYSPDSGRLKEGQTVVITATCNNSEPLKKDTTMIVVLSNGKNIALSRASDNTFVGNYVVQCTGSSVAGYRSSQSDVDVETKTKEVVNPDGSISVFTTTTTTTNTEDISLEEKDDTEDTDNLLAVGYDVGTAEDENGGALVANSPVAGVAAMQPSGHLSVATKIPELIKIEYVIERFGKGAGAGAGAGKATGQATTEDQKPLEAGDKIVITATCTHASSSELKRGTEMTLLMSNGKSVILKHDGRGYDDTYVGEYVIGPDASEDCDVLGASGYNCGTAEDEHGNALDANTTIQSASMFQPTQPIVIDTQASARAAARAAADAKTAAEAKAAAAAQEKAAAAQEKAAAAARTAAAAKAAEDTRIVAEAAAAAAAAAAIAAESAAQTEARKARVQTELKAMLLGDTNTWTYTLSPSMKINEQENVDVNQGGDGGARGELAVGLYGVNDVDVLVVYSHSDQIFTMEQDLKVGNTIIPQASIIDLNLITLSNKIRFKPNTTIVVDECKHICRRVAKLLNINPDIRIRVDGHVKMKKKYRKDPAMMGQAERLSELRAKSVVQELVGFGIDASRMDHKGFGGSKPLPKGQDDKRVEISVL